MLLWVLAASSYAQSQIMVAHPGEYRWSSYRSNAQGELAPLLTPHPVYTSLGSADCSCSAAYRELFRFKLDPALVDEIRKATNGNFALGDHRFAVDIEKSLGRRVLPGKSGRPHNQPMVESLDLFDHG